MTKALEILFRNKVKLLLLLLLPVIISLGVVYVLPRQYQATADLLALRRYETLGATGPESDLTSSPATTQATALNELLLTRSFSLAVAYDTDLPKHIGNSGGDVQATQDALFAEISGHVVVTAVGYSLFEITYTYTDPVIAMQVVKAVVAHYSTQSSSLATAEGEQLLISYQSQLTAAQNQAQAATDAAAQYLQQHNTTAAAAQSDPKYLYLSAQADQARAALASVQGNINTINQELATLNAGSSGLYTTIDAPTVPSKPVSRTKSLLLGGGIGLAIGLLASIIFFLLLSRLDQAIYSLADVEELTPYPVLVQIPRLPRKALAWTPQVGSKLQLEKGK